MKLERIDTLNVKRRLMITKMAEQLEMQIDKLFLTLLG